MAPRKSTSAANSATNSPAKSSLQQSNGVMAPTAKSSSYEPGATPIKFYVSTLLILLDKFPKYRDADSFALPLTWDIQDDEVKRMHTELEQRQRDGRLTPRKPLRPKPSSQGVTFRGFLARVFIFYLFIAYFLVCPTDSSRERAVCRGIDSVQQRIKVYEPHFRPYLNTAHAKLDPYVARVRTQVDPWVEKATPYYSKADSFVRPHVANLATQYQTHAHPRILQGISASQEATKPYMAKLRKQYTQLLAPSVEWYSHAGKQWYAANLEPHVTVAQKKAYEYAAPVYHHGIPYAQKQYTHSFKPFVQSSYKTSRTTYLQSVHPHVVTTGSHIYRFYLTKILPTLQRSYSLYVAPQVDKITEKIYEYRTKKYKAEAVNVVQEKEEVLAEEHDVDDLDDFIAELRDTTYTDEDPVEVPVATPSRPAKPVLSEEERRILTAEKRATLETLQATYEQEIAKLGQVEHDLLLKRLIDIRSKAVDDVPKRFRAPLTDLDEQGDKMVGRLGKYFARASTDEKLTVEEKVKDADFLAKKAVEKVQKAAQDILDEVEAYRAEVRAKETSAVARAADAVEELTSKAQTELSFGWTWLDDVTAKDWTRYHALNKASGNWKGSYVGTQTGTIPDSTLASHDYEKALSAVETEANTVVTTFESILSKIKVKGQKELKGEWTGVRDEAAKAYDGVSGKVAEVVEAVKASASSVAGVKPTPSNVQESVSSVVASAYAAIPTVPAIPTDKIIDTFSSATESIGSFAEAASSSLESFAAEASQTIIRKAGYEPSPTNVAQSATSLAKSISSAIHPPASSGVLSDASSVASVASASASSLAAQAASSASSLAAAGAGAVSSAAKKVSSAAAPHPSFTAGEPVLSKISSLGDTAASIAGDASQSIIRAVGGTPSPTDVAQSASSVAKKVASQASVVRKAVVSSASSAGSVASSYASPHPSFKAGEPVLSMVSSSVAASASSVSRKAASQASVVRKVVSSSASSIASVASSYASPHPSFASGEPILSKISSLGDSAASIAGDASQSVIRAAGGTPSPTNVAQSASSVAKKASSQASVVRKAAVSSASKAASVASSYASPHPSFSKSTGVAEKIASVVKDASSALHDATRTTPEGVKEHATSIASAAKSAASSVLHGEL